MAEKLSISLWPDASSATGVAISSGEVERQEGNSPPENLSWMLAEQNATEQPSVPRQGEDILVVTSYDNHTDNDDDDVSSDRLYVVKAISYDDFCAIIRECGSGPLTEEEEVYENYLAQTLWVGCLPKGVELVFNGTEAPSNQEVFEFAEDDDDLGFVRPGLVRRLNEIDKLSPPCVFAVMESDSHRAAISSRVSPRQNRRYKMDMELRLCPKVAQGDDKVFKFGYNFETLGHEAAHVIQVKLHHYASGIWRQQLLQSIPFAQFTQDDSFAKEMVGWIRPDTFDSCETFQRNIHGQGTEYYTRNEVVKRALYSGVGTRLRRHARSGGAKRRRT